MGRALSVACLAAAIVTTPAIGAEPVSLQPTVQWHVSMEADKCRALRIFGPEASPTLLIIDQLEPNGVAEWAIAGEAVKTLESGRGDYDIRFGAIEPVFPSKWVVKGTLAAYGPALTGSSFAVRDQAIAMRSRGNKRDGAEIPVAPPFAHANGSDIAKPGIPTAEIGGYIDHIDLERSGQALARLETGPLDQVFTLMTKCSDNMVRAWGLDPEIERTVVKRPAPKSVGALANALLEGKSELAKTYPANAKLKLHALVSAEGRIDKCWVTEITAGDNLDTLTCKAVSKMRFTPAQNAAGEAVPSHYTIGIFYQDFGR